MSVPQLPQADDGSFDQVVLSDPSPALVEFYTPWCGHCRRMAPIIEELARDYAGRIRVIQVNAAENTGTARRFGVRGVPTMLILTDGKEVRRIVGEASRAALDGQIGQALDRASGG
jgi:thioredoxin